jgi:hypothetical protein
MKYHATTPTNTSTMIAHSHPSPLRFGSTLISAIQASENDAVG